MTRLVRDCKSKPPKSLARLNLGVSKQSAFAWFKKTRMIGIETGRLGGHDLQMLIAEVCIIAASSCRTNTVDAIEVNA